MYFCHFGNFAQLYRSYFDAIQHTHAMCGEIYTWVFMISRQNQHIQHVKCFSLKTCRVEKGQPPLCESKQLCRQTRPLEQHRKWQGFFYWLANVHVNRCLVGDFRCMYYLACVSKDYVQQAMQCVHRQQRMLNFTMCSCLILHLLSRGCAWVAYRQQTVAFLGSYRHAWSVYCDLVMHW